MPRGVYNRNKNKESALDTKVTHQAECNKVKFGLEDAQCNCTPTIEKEPVLVEEDLPSVPQEEPLSIEEIVAEIGAEEASKLTKEDFVPMPPLGTPREEVLPPSPKEIIATIRELAEKGHEALEAKKAEEEKILQTIGVELEKNIDGLWDAPTLNERINTDNIFSVRKQVNSIFVLRVLPGRMRPTEALVFAAHIVRLADPKGTMFPAILKAVQKDSV